MCYTAWPQSLCFQVFTVTLHHITVLTVAIRRCTDACMRTHHVRLKDIELALCKHTTCGSCDCALSTYCSQACTRISCQRIDAHCSISDGTVTSLTDLYWCNRCRGGGTDADRHSFLAKRAAAVKLQRALRNWALYRRVTLAIHLQRLWRGCVIQFKSLKFEELPFF
jgi:hypothetical protein